MAARRDARDPCRLRGPVRGGGSTGLRGPRLRAGRAAKRRGPLPPDPAVHAGEGGGRLEAIEPGLRVAIDEYPARPMFRCMLAVLYADLSRPEHARAVFEQLAARRLRGDSLTNEWLFSLGFLAETAVFLGDLDRA